MSINTGQNLSSGGKQGILIDISHPSLDTLVEWRVKRCRRRNPWGYKGGGPGGGKGYYVLGARDYPVVKSRFYSTVQVVF